MSTVDLIDLPYPQNATHLFEAIRDLPAPIWLDSGKPRSLQGRFDIISAAPLITIETEGLTTTISKHQSSANVPEKSKDNPFLLAEQVLKEMGPVSENPGVPFCGGLAGYFGYNLARSKQQGAKALVDLAELPDLRLGYYVWALVINHQNSRAWLVFHPACSKALRKDVSKRLKTAEPKEPGTCTAKNNNNFSLITKFIGSISRDDYAKKFNLIKEYIAAGDCYQVNYAQHFSAHYEGDPWCAYQLLRATLPSPFSAFMAWDNKAILSLSPERFIKLSRGQVETRPIKGTAPRGTNIDDDREKAIALMNSAKDRAENLMIVDLLRNDLGKSCQPGSIHVPGLFKLESFANVHHLVSTVTGTLAENKSALDLFAGCFPGGSITGAPKRRAMEIIQEMEQVNRSIYCGSIGYISACGRMDTNIAIRTLATNAGKIHCWGGGGIVADSNMDSEYAESLSKISLLMDSL